MEKLQTSKQVGLTTTSLNTLAIAINEINLCVSPAFPIKPETIVSWTDKILELVPGVTEQKIKQAIRNIQRGVYDFDERNGIRDLVKILLEMNKTESRRINLQED